MTDEIKEARAHIETCLYDLADPQASHKRKRRALEWLGYWATELELSAGQSAEGSTRKS